MKRKRKTLLGALVILSLTGCSTPAPADNDATPAQETDKTADQTPAAKADTQSEPESQTEPKKEDENMTTITLTVDGQTLQAELEDNETTRALLEQMPMTLPMMDLYDREMCYRYGEGALPVGETTSSGYHVGDIAYWPPAGSLVILYAQNGEHFERVHLGRVLSGVEIFENTGDADVSFEIAE